MKGARLRRFGATRPNKHPFPTSIACAPLPFKWKLARSRRQTTVFAKLKRLPLLFNSSLTHIVQHSRSPVLKEFAIWGHSSFCSKIQTAVSIWLMDFIVERFCYKGCQWYSFTFRPLMKWKVVSIARLAESIVFSSVRRHRHTWTSISD